MRLSSARARGRDNSCRSCLFFFSRLRSTAEFKDVRYITDSPYQTESKSMPSLAVRWRNCCFVYPCERAWKPNGISPTGRYFHSNARSAHVFEYFPSSQGWRFHCQRESCWAAGLCLLEWIHMLDIYLVLHMALRNIWKEISEGNHVSNWSRQRLPMESGWLPIARLLSVDGITGVGYDFSLYSNYFCLMLVFTIACCLLLSAYCSLLRVFIIYIFFFSVCVGMPWTSHEQQTPHIFVMQTN